MMNRLTAEEIKCWVFERCGDTYLADYYMGVLQDLLFYQLAKLCEGDIREIDKIVMSNKLCHQCQNWERDYCIATPETMFCLKRDQITPLINARVEEARKQEGERIRGRNKWIRRWTI